MMKSQIVRDAFGGMAAFLEISNQRKNISEPASQIVPRWLAA